MSRKKRQRKLVTPKRRSSNSTECGIPPQACRQADPVDLPQPEAELVDEAADAAPQRETVPSESDATTASLPDEASQEAVDNPATEATASDDSLALRDDGSESSSSGDVTQKSPEFSADHAPQQHIDFAVSSALRRILLWTLAAAAPLLATLGAFFYKASEWHIASHLQSVRAEIDAAVDAKQGKLADRIDTQLQTADKEAREAERRIHDAGRINQEHLFRELADERGQAKTLLGDIRNVRDSIEQHWRDVQSASDSRFVVLLTDFGPGTAYLARFRGKILSAAPHARLIDINHSVSQFNHLEASWTLFNAARSYPQGTVFMAVVNPGADVQRSVLIVTRSPRFIFIGAGPEVFDHAAREFGVSEIYRVLPETVYETFGTDTYAKVIIQILASIPLTEIDNLKQHEPYQPVLDYGPDTAKVTGDGDTLQIHGNICAVDRWGNLQTNIPLPETNATSEDAGDDNGLMEHFNIERYFDVRLEFGSRPITLSDFKFSRSYSGVPRRGRVLVRQDGWLQIAINQGSAAEAFWKSVNDVEQRPHDLVNTLTGRRVIVIPHANRLESREPSVAMVKQCRDCIANAVSLDDAQKGELLKMSQLLSEQQLDERDRQDACRDFCRLVEELEHSPRHPPRIQRYLGRLHQLAPVIATQLASFLGEIDEVVETEVRPSECGSDRSL